LPSPVTYSYKIGEEVYDVPSLINCTIIDYGTAHVEGLASYYINEYLRDEYGVTSNMAYFNRDIYSLVMFAFRDFLVYKSPEKLGNFFKFENPLRAMVEKLFEEYEGKIFVEGAYRTIVTSYRKRYSSFETLQERKDYMERIMNDTRLDKKYFLYLPKGYSGRGVYSNQYLFLNFLRSILNLENFPKDVYRWGDYEKIGCESKKEVAAKALEEIAKLKALEGKKSPRRPPPAAGPDGASEPRRPREERTPPGKRTPPKKKSPPKENITEKEADILSEIKKYNADVVNPTLAGIKIPKAQCEDVAQGYEKFWNFISGSKDKKIKTNRDLLKFKREVLKKYHPDKNPDKLVWATEMSREIGLFFQYCEHQLD
jgi:hypothetical protein